MPNWLASSMRRGRGGGGGGGGGGRSKTKMEKEETNPQHIVTQATQ